MREIYLNGTVRVQNSEYAQAFAVENGKFIFVGSNEQAMKYAQGDSKIEDLGGRFVCAGFNDSHMHLLNYGYAATVANLSENIFSIEQLCAAVGEFINENHIPAGEWVCGKGWNQDHFRGEKRFPTRYDLDRISTEHPISLTRACEHCCVGNSKALELAGISKDTPQPEKGYFEVDSNGEPLGIFRENAMQMICSKIPQPGKDDIKKMLVTGMKKLNSYGVTSCQSDDFSAFLAVPYDVIIDAYRELEREGKMTVRVGEQAFFREADKFKKFMDDGRAEICGDRFKMSALKLLGDGSLGSRSARLSRPYADAPDKRGVANFTVPQFYALIKEAHTRGFRAVVHCIGDGILDDVLDCFERVNKEFPRTDCRHGIVHCQITRPEQLQKIAQLGLCVFAQTIFIDYDMHIVYDRVGQQLAQSSYNFKTLRDMGVVVSNGSDCPVEEPNVMRGIQCAVTRTDLKGTQPPYLPEQAFSVEQALDSYTTDGAYNSFEQDRKGRIQAGMIADFTVLGQNILETEPSKIKDIKIYATYLGGQKVYG